MVTFRIIAHHPAAKSRVRESPWSRYNRHERFSDVRGEVLMVRYDFVIRGGTVVDGSGRGTYEADVAVRDGRIAAVDRVAGSGIEEFDARGLIVTPGFIDVHTHLDGFVTWAQRLNPSTSQGVTTVMFGNCGVGFAPCRREDRDTLVHLMEGVEDIPGIVLTEGLPWNWTSFPEYLNFLDGRQYDADIAALLPHAPMRVFVMGERAAAKEAATPQEIAAMVSIARDALSAGAFGFATSRSINHRASDGTHTPSLQAKQEELFALSAAVGDAGTGIVQMISDFQDIDADFQMVRDMALHARRPLTLTVVQLPHAPTRWRALLGKIAAANQDGLQITGQVIGRPVGLFLGLEVSYSPFAFCPTVQALDDREFSDKLARFRDPQIRERILQEFTVPLEQRKAEIAKAFESRTVDSFSMARTLTNFDRMFALGDPPRYDPAPDKSIANIAKRAGRTAAEVAYDAMLEQEGHGLIYVPAANYADGNLDSVREMLMHNNTVLGLSDAGAHYSLICDATASTYMLSYWARDRQTDGIPLPRVVRSLTQQGAELMGLRDRGLIAPGMRADINIIDFDKVRLHHPRVVYDLPAGGKRLTQDAEGFVMTFVRGIPTYRDGEFTGALPGRLLRSGRSVS
jgi:N-acyl-D-amino-acid deacylase